MPQGTRLRAPIDHFVAKLLFVFALTLLTGCTSPTYNKMPSQHDIPQLAAMLDDAPSLDKHIVTTRGPGDHPLDVAVWTTSQQRPDVIILLHGVLADHGAWRFVSGRLFEDHDLILVDLPGAGAGEMLNPATLKKHDQTAYSLDGLAPRAAEAISAVIDRRPVPAERIAIVAHSLGTLVTLHMLTDHASSTDSDDLTAGRPDHDWLDRVDRIVLISPVDPAMPYGPPSLETIATTSGFAIEAGQTLGLIRERLALGAKRSFVDGERIPREQVDILYDIVTTTPRRRVAQDTLRTILPTVKIDGVYYPDWPRIEPFVRRVRDLGRRDDIAWLLIVGERDEVAPASMAYRLAAQLARATIIAIANTKHSPQLERPQIVASYVSAFLDGDAIDDAHHADVHERRVIP